MKSRYFLLALFASLPIVSGNVLDPETMREIEVRLSDLESRTDKLDKKVSNQLEHVSNVKSRLDFFGFIPKYIAALVAKISK